MYDNINMKLSIAEAKGIDFINDIPGLLTRCSQTTFDNGSISISGYHGSLKVRVSEQAVKIQDSSLCKWFLGDNFQALTRGDVRRAVERLSDELHLPMNRANITRIDIAQNFIMNHEKDVYFNHLGALQYFQRYQQNNGLYYLNSNKILQPP